MKPTARLFHCVGCHKQTLICSHCDRGQLYCSQSCASRARRQSCRLAEKRYQQTHRGKVKHALRQRRYRARLTKKVTDQGSPALPQNVLLNSVKNQAITMQYCEHAQCCFCRRPVSSWVRQGFLRHGITNKARAGP